MSPRKPRKGGVEKPTPSRQEVFAALRRDADGIRGLQGYLDEIKDFNDAAFAEATGGADRAETMELLTRLNILLADVDKVTAQLHPDAN